MERAMILYWTAYAIAVLTIVGMIYVMFRAFMAEIEETQAMIKRLLGDRPRPRIRDILARLP
jgi:hypothetical protein